jgi:hypothetical protein
MKKIFLIILCLFSIIGTTMACDICGCGAGSNYLGILPDFNAKIVGLRFRNSEISTHVGADGQHTYLTTQEYYNTFEFWGGWNIGRHFRVMATLPVSYNAKSSADVDISKTGMGDAMIQGFYQLLNKQSMAFKNKMLVQDIRIGGGIKLPTGKYNPLDEQATNEGANLFQLGTGSFDFIITGMYDIRLQDIGINIAASYKMNTANKYGYNYGNKVSTNAQLYYKFRVKESLTLSPNAGLSYENAATDLNDGNAVFTSGGYALFGTAGLEAKYKNLAIGGNWQPSISQHLAAGIVQAKNKMMIHVAVMF